MVSAAYVSQVGTGSPGPAGQDDLILSSFIERHPDGVFVDTDKLPSAEEFQRVVERIFRSGYYFSGLDYGRFQRLLFDFDRVRGGGWCRLADEIREFPVARRALYKGVKLIRGDVEYIFEPVLLESTVDEPIYGTDEHGETVVTGQERRVVSEKATLDVDEFVADLWTKGVRFGIDVERVREAIQSGRCERIVVARERAPGPGTDAGIEEQTPELHRDNAPRELPNGRIDLGQFKNRFPQIKAGTVLLKKTPRVLGDGGRSVDGRYLEPPMPKDFDLAALAGPGTKIEHRAGGDFIIATMDGFLDLDGKTNCISITEKIVHREGVSARTTGNLALAGDEYEEFGEVQEGRTVEGRSLTFHANVFGKVLSEGGYILLHNNLVGATALNRNGPITVNGLASNSLVHTAKGTVHVKRAENSVLIGERVEVEWASNCTILAEEVDIEAAEGCAIAGKRVHLAMGRSRSGEETLVSMLLPDLSAIDKAEAKEGKHIAECEELAGKLQRGIEQITSQPEVRQYLAIAGKLHRKEITLSPEQQGPWHQMRNRLAPTLKRISQGRDDIKVLEEEMASARQRLTDLAGEREKAGAAVECAIDHVLGDLVVRTLTLPLDAPPLTRLPPRELKQRLRAPGGGGRPLFSGSSGQFAWKPENSKN